MIHANIDLSPVTERKTCLSILVFYFSCNWNFCVFLHYHSLTKAVPIKSVFNLIYKQGNQKISYPNLSNHQPSNPKITYILTVAGNLKIYNFKLAECRDVLFHLFWVQLFYIPWSRVPSFFSLCKRLLEDNTARVTWEIPGLHRAGVTKIWNPFL